MHHFSLALPPPFFFPSNNPWEFERHPLICSSSPPPSLHPSSSSSSLHPPLALPPSFLSPDVSRIASHSFSLYIYFYFCAFLNLNPFWSSSLLSGKCCKTSNGSHSIPPVCFLLVTCIDVIASLGFPWKHGRTKNRSTLIQTPSWGREEVGVRGSWKGLFSTTISFK